MSDAPELPRKTWPAVPPFGEVWQLVVHPAVSDRLSNWLGYHGIDLFPMPHNEDDLPSYGMAPRDLGGQP